MRDSAACGLTDPVEIGLVLCELIQRGECTCLEILLNLDAAWQECYNAPPPATLIAFIIECCGNDAPVCDGRIDSDCNIVAFPQCPSACDNLDAWCDQTLRPWLEVAIVCALENDCGLTSLDLLCMVFEECNTQSPGCIDCDEALACAARVLARPLTAEEILQLLTCLGCSTCVNGAPPDITVDGVCDRNGDGVVDCDDLIFYITQINFCRAENGDPALGPQELVDAMCDFFSACQLQLNWSCEQKLACAQILMRQLPPESQLRCAEAVSLLQCIGCPLDWCANDVFTVPIGICDLTLDGRVDREDICVFLRLVDDCPDGISTPDKVSRLCDWLTQNGEECLQRIRQTNDFPDSTTTCTNIANWVTNELNDPSVYIQVLNCLGCQFQPPDSPVPPLPVREEDVKSGDNDNCGDASGSGGEAGVSANPVHTFYGFKQEYATDLVIPLTGGDFHVTRQYSSTTNYQQESAGWIGWNWSLSILRRMDTASPELADEDEYLSVAGTPSDRRTVYKNDPGNNTWSTEATGNQRIVNETVNLPTLPDGINVNKLIEPGAWEQWYYSKGNTEHGPEIQNRNGSLLYEVDVHGNFRLYHYEMIEVFGTPKPVLVQITCNGTRLSNSEATINIAHNDPGRISSLTVWRPAADNTFRETQVVEYTYSDGTQHQDVSDTQTHLNLVQVSKSVLVDLVDGLPDIRAWNRFWTQITQYRYHDGMDGLPGGSQDERLNVDGGKYHLKMVIEPEQIEFVAQEARANDDPVLFRALDVTAGSMLGLSDTGTVLGTTHEIVDMASKIIGYDESDGDDTMGGWQPQPDPHVVTQFQQSACGCGGGATPQGVKLTYDYFDGYTAESGNPGQTTRISEFLLIEGQEGVYESDAYRVAYYDHEMFDRNWEGLDGNNDPVTIKDGIPYVVNHAIQEGHEPSNARFWVTHYEYDTDGGNVDTYNKTAEFTPSAMASYSPSTGVGIAPSYSAKTSDGLSLHYAYTNDNRVKLRQVRGGTSNPLVTIEEINYPTMQGVNERLYLPSSIVRHRVANAGVDDDKEVTEFKYLFHTSPEPPDALAGIETKVERELMTENGPDSSLGVFSYELFDGDGLSVYSVHPDDSVTMREFDDRNGLPTRVTSNWDPNGFDFCLLPLPGDGPNRCGGWGSNSDPLATSTTTYDALGRVIETVSAGGVRTYLRRVMRTNPDDRPGLYYFAVERLPHLLESEGAFNGPASVTIQNASGETIRSSEFLVDANAPYDPLANKYTLDESLAGEIARSVVDHRLSGLVEQTHRFHSVEDVAGDGGKYTTSYEYDQLGRRTVTVNGVGTVEHCAYDVLDRKISVAVGLSTDPAHASVRTTREIYYDGSVPGTRNGVGNSNVTLIRRFTGDDGTLAADVRDTGQMYDFRDRLMERVNPEAPHEAFTYDNLDRVVAEELYEEDTFLTKTRLVETAYSQRGAVYRTRRAIDPVDPGISGYLETHTWYDDKGRVIARWAPTSAGVKTAYDALDRATVSYTTDRALDAAPGSSGNFDDAASVSDDHVLEQTEFSYDREPVGTTQNLLVMETLRVRSHDQGAVVGVLDHTNSVTTYSGVMYDEADRPIRAIDFGTNGLTDVFRSGGASPINLLERPDIVFIPDPGEAVDNNWKNTLISASAYDTRGLAFSTIDPTGTLETLTAYDDLSRSIAVIENADAFDVDQDIVWENADGRWDIVNATLTDERNRVTSFVYDGIDNVVKRAAHIPGGDPQVTEYLHDFATRYGGTTPGLASDPDATLIASNDLLYEVRYPDVGDSQPTYQDVETLSYNAQGELRRKTDPYETTHDFKRDLLGRVLEDIADRPMGSDIDLAVKSIRTVWDDSGRVLRVESLDDLGGVLNAVGYAYDTLWNVVKVRQDVDSELDELTGTPTEEVVYTYDSEPVGTGNFNRVASTIFPDGEVFSHDFATGTDSAISRISGFSLDSDLSQLVEYSYLGLSTAAVVDYPIPDVQLDFTLASDGSRNLTGGGTSGLYPGFDRLGRVIRQTWAPGNLTTGSPGLPNRPPHVERLYAYDKASNRLLNHDGRPGQLVADRDFELLYDGLHRAEEVKRGQWNGTSMTLSSGSRLWNLDVLGNWDEQRTDLNGDGNYSGLADALDDRGHNDANEIASRTLTGGGGSGTQTISWDPAGQLRNKGAVTYTHDAWGRLVKAELGSGSPTVVGRYEYFGTHWRSVRERDTTLPRDGLDERRHLYYGIDWKLCEEHVDESWSGSAHTTDVIAQNFWGTRHIDDAVMRRRRDEPGDWANDQLTRTYYLTDVQFSTLALINDNSFIAERVLYNAYGEGEHRWRRDVDGDGDVDNADGNAISAAVGTSIGDPNYNVDADLDLDGDVDFTDVLVTGSGPQPKLAGEISSLDNIIGFDGYCYDNETTLYSVRHRCYDPDLGRFIQRDPERYADGMSLYEYVRSSPFVLMDPMGLAYVAPSDARNYSAFGGSSADAQFYHPGGTTLPRQDRLAFNQRIADWQTSDRAARQRQQLETRMRRDAERYAREYFQSDLYRNDHSQRDVTDCARWALFENAIHQRFTDADVAGIWRGVAWDAATTVASTLVEPVDWAVSGSEVLQGNWAAGAGFLPFVPGAVGKMGRAVPNPYGKLGGPRHRAVVAEVVEDISTRGLSAQTEVAVRTVNGARQTRYMDVVARDANGQIVEVHQVGRGLKSNKQHPVSRERDALRDVRQSPMIRGAKRIFHPYN